MLKSIDEQIDKPLIIKEIEDNDFLLGRSSYSNVAVGQYKEESKLDTDYLEIKPIKLKYAMFARFKIK